MADLAFDIYPADDPRNGDLLVRLTKADFLDGTSYRSALRGTGSGMIVIHSEHAAVQAGHLSADNYVRVVDLGYDEIIGGFFLMEGEETVLSRDEQGGEVRSYGGPGTLSYLARATFPNVLRSAVDEELGQHQAYVDATGYLRFTGPETYGGVLGRIIYEARLDEPSAVPDLPAHSWDDVEDSGGTNWTTFTGDYDVRIGDNVLELALDLMKKGIDLMLDPHTFTPRAYLEGTYGTDRTSATFASGKVRFQAGVNIMADLEKAIHRMTYVSHLLVVGSDNVTEGEYVDPDWSPGDTVYRDTLRLDNTIDALIMEEAAAEYVRERKVRANQATFPIRSGADPDNGYYAAGIHFVAGDYVTLHSGTGEHDYNEQSIQVAAIQWNMHDNGQFIPTVELGSQYIDAQTAAEIRQLTTLIDTSGPNPQLCVAGTVASETVIDWDWLGGTAEDVDAYSPLGQAATISPVSNFDLFSTENGWISESRSGTTPTYLPSGGTSPELAAFPVIPGTAYTVVANMRCPATGKAPSVAVVWLSGVWGGYVVESEEAPLVGVVESTVFTEETGTFTAPAGATAAVFKVSDATRFERLTVTSSSGASNDGHPDLVNPAGTRAARCGHRHDVHRDTAPTVADDESIGYKLGTIWAQLDDLENPTEIVGTWMLIDAAEGAAVWASFGGGGGSYTDEEAQDAIGTILTDTSTVDFTYTDATPSITAAVIPGGIKLDDLGTPDDNTDLNASTSRHGLLKKLSNVATEYMDGTGNWSTPAGGGGGVPLPDDLDDNYRPESAGYGAGTGTDEFNNASFSGWTLTGTGLVSGDFDESTFPGHVQMTIPAARGVNQVAYRAAYTSGDFTLRAKVTITKPFADAGMWGIIIADSSGNGVGILEGGTTTTNRISTWLANIVSWNYSTSISTTNFDGWRPLVTHFGLPMFFELQKVGTSYTGRISFNGMVTNYAVTGTPTAFTVANIGFGRFFNAGSGTNVALWDYVRSSL